MNLAVETNAELKQLKELLALAADSASQAMHVWTGSEVHLSFGDVCEVELSEVDSLLGSPDELLTMVLLTLEGDLGGQLILAFDEVNARQVAATLLKQPPRDGEWTRLEISAIEETGNILACAFVNVLTDQADAPLVPSPPYFIQDYGATVIEQAVMMSVMDSDRVIVSRSSFEHASTQLNWHVIFTPTSSLRQTLAAQSDSYPT